MAARVLIICLSIFLTSVSFADENCLATISNGFNAEAFREKPTGEQLSTLKGILRVCFTCAPRSACGNAYRNIIRKRSEKAVAESMNMIKAAPSLISNTTSNEDTKVFPARYEVDLDAADQEGFDTGISL